MDEFAGSLNEHTASNRSPIAATMKNLNDSSQLLKGLLADLKAGKGLAGTLLENEQLAAHVSLVASNLSVTTSNLNRIGIWGVLWSHKPRPKPSTARPVRPLLSPKESDNWE
jgi:hypothetical protein